MEADKLRLEEMKRHMEEGGSAAKRHAIEKKVKKE